MSTDRNDSSDGTKPEPERTEVPIDGDDLVSGPRGGQGSQDGGTTADGGVAVQRAEPDETGTEKGA